MIGRSVSLVTPVFHLFSDLRYPAHPEVLSELCIFYIVGQARTGTMARVLDSTPQSMLGSMGM